MDPLSGPRVMTQLSKIGSQRWLALLKRLRKRRRPFIVSGLEAVSFQRQRDSEDAHGRHGFRLM